MGKATAYVILFHVLVLTWNFTKVLLVDVKIASEGQASQLSDSRFLFVFSSFLCFLRVSYSLFTVCVFFILFSCPCLFSQSSNLSLHQFGEVDTNCQTVQVEDGSFWEPFMHGFFSKRDFWPVSSLGSLLDEEIVPLVSKKWKIMHTWSMFEILLSAFDFPIGLSFYGYYT